MCEMVWVFTLMSGITVAIFMSIYLYNLYHMSVWPIRLKWTKWTCICKMNFDPSEAEIVLEARDGFDFPEAIYSNTS